MVEQNATTIDSLVTAVI